MLLFNNNQLCVVMQHTDCCFFFYTSMTCCVYNSQQDKVAVSESALPLVLTVAMHLVVRTSQMRMVLSPDAVTNRSGLVGCQHN